MEYVGVNWTQEEVGMEGKRSELAVVKQKVRLQEWSAQVEAQQASGLNVREWCAENGIAPNTYYNHKKSTRAISQFFSGNRAVECAAAKFRYPN